MSLSLIAELVVTGLLLGLTYAAAALGLSLTMGVLRIFNVTHGIVIVITGLIVWQLVGNGVPLLLAILIAVALAFGAGMATDKLLQRSDSNENFGGLLALFGLMIVLESVSSMYWGSDFKLLRVPMLAGSVDLGFMRISHARLFAAALSLAGVVGLFVFLNRTMLGKAIRAVARDRDAARVMGIPVDRVTSLVFGIGTAFAAIGGTAIALVFSFAPQTHFRWLIWAILVVVLGGLGSVRGTALAALVVGFIEAFGGALISFQYIQLLIYALLVVVLFLRGEGVSGVKERSV